MELKNSSGNIDHIARNNNNNRKMKPFHFFVIFVAISIVIAFIIGGYFLGKDKAKEEQNAETEISKQIKIDVTELPNNPEKWTEFELESLGISIKLPETLTDLGDWTESGESIICFSNETSDEICKNKNLIIASASNSFETENFQGVKGFEENKNIFTIIKPDGAYSNLNNTKLKVYKDGNFEILKILGDENESTPDEGYLGAVVNTNNINYPALILLMKIDGDLQEFEFDQILGSLEEL